jgi:hypothetical protein
LYDSSDISGLKRLNLLALVACALALSQCKAPTEIIQPLPTPSLVEVRITLDTAAGLFQQFAKQTNGDPYKAMFLTADALLDFPDVQSAITLDSINIDIRFKSGLKATFCIDQVDDRGVSVFRGGGRKGMQSSLKDLQVQKFLAAHTIMNDSVLFFAAGFSEFGLSSCSCELRLRFRI